MERATKEKLVSEFKERFDRAEAAFVTEYKGVNVEGISKLRSTLKEGGGEMKVVRNTLAAIASKGTDIEGLSEYFKGQVSISLSYEDPAHTAKTLTKFAEDNENLVIKAGILSGNVIDINQIKALSELPSKPELLGQVAGLLNNIPTTVARMLAGVPTKVATGVQALHDSKNA